MRTRTIRLNLRAVTGLSAAFGLALAFASLPAAAQRWTPQQRAACEPDAMRLCNQYIPDVQRTSACMSHYRRYLSPSCRAVFYGGQRKKVDAAEKPDYEGLAADRPAIMREAKAERSRVRVPFSFTTTYSYCIHRRDLPAWRRAAWEPR